MSTCNFSKSKNCTCPTGSWNFTDSEKFMRAYLNQISLEIMLLPIPIFYSSPAKLCWQQLIIPLWKPSDLHKNPCPPPHPPASDKDWSQNIVL